MKKNIKGVTIICLNFLLLNNCANRQPAINESVSESLLIEDSSDESSFIDSIIMPKPETKKVIEVDAISNLYIANGVVANSKYFSTQLIGDATASIIGIKYHQKTFTRRIINDNEAFNEAISSSSLVKIANQRYIFNDNYFERSSKKITDENTGDYSKSEITIESKKSYIEKYGSLPFDMSQYILNEKTILSGEMVSFEDNLYTFEYILDPILATKNYAYSVKSMSNASSLPEFKNVKMSITIDETWHVKTIQTYEIYNLYILGGVEVSAHAIETFTFNEAATYINEKEAFIEYLR